MRIAFFYCYHRKLHWTLLPFFVLLRLFAGGEQLLIKSRRLLLLLPCSCLGTVSFLITADKKMLLFVERESVPFTCCVHEWLKVCEGPSCIVCISFLPQCTVWYGGFLGDKPTMFVLPVLTLFFSVVIASLRRCLFKITGQNKDQRFWSARLAWGEGINVLVEMSADEKKLQNVFKFSSMDQLSCHFFFSTVPCVRFLLCNSCM